MRGRSTIVAVAFVVMTAATSAAAQENTEIASADGSTIGLRTAAVVGPVSPSSATSSISPSTVPQAMDRMEEPDTIADVSLGSLYAEGDFGAATKTRIWSTALGARLHLGDWKLSASLPWMRIRSNSTFFTGIDATPILIAPDTFATRRTSRGFGDLTLGASYTVAPAGSSVEVELSGRAKLNTASDGSHLSSGKNDYSAGIDVSVPRGALIPFVSFTYRFLGDTAQYSLRDGPAASAGASYAIGTKSFVLASYHYARAATRFVDDSHEIFAGASTQLGNSPLRVTAFATTGLSRGAADVSAGIALSFGFRGRNGRVS